MAGFNFSKLWGPRGGEGGGGANYSNLITNKFIDVLANQFTSRYESRMRSFIRINKRPKPSNCDDVIIKIHDHRKICRGYINLGHVNSTGL